MNNFSIKNYFSKISEKIRNNKKIQIVIIFVLILIFLLVFLITKENKKQVESVIEKDYVTNLENKLSNVLSNVKGAGKVSVVITLESGMETVLASKITVKENGNTKETEETPIIINGKTVTLKECYPKVSGVLIVAEGADNISVVYKIQQATISLLDVELCQIEILTMK